MSINSSGLKKLNVSISTSCLSLIFELNFYILNVLKRIKRKLLKTSVKSKGPQGCTRFPEILQNFSERHILWSLCSVVFHTLTLKLPIQTSLSVAPKLPVSARSHEKHPNFRKTSTPVTKIRGHD